MKRSIPYPRNILMSFYYFKEYNLDQLPNLTIIGDSGAFSAASQGAIITTKDLATWGQKWRHKLAWIAALDVIGDPKATYRNWRDMVDNHGVEAVPTIHYGTDPSEMDKYAAKGVDFLGLGGLVGKEGKSQMRWLVQVFKYQQKHHPDMRFHGWGCTSERHAALPFFSVDSSSWTGSLRYGTMVLREPGTNKRLTFQLDGREAFKPRVARMLVDYYGASPREVAVSNSSNREEMVKLSALATSVQEQYLRKLHSPVSAPSWGINARAYGDAVGGTHLHLAESSLKNLPTLNDAAGPHLHMACGSATGNSNPTLIRDLHERQEVGAGPHLHMACGYGPTHPDYVENLHKDNPDD